MSDELAPLFESRETRLGRLPAEARSKLEVAANAVPTQPDFVDKQFVSLWLARRVGLPRQDVLSNFDKIAARFFGDGTTAAGAYDRIAKTYAPVEAKPAGEAGGAPAAGAAPVAEDAEYAPTEGLARVGQGFFGQMRDTVTQSARAFGGGFEGFGQQVPAGLYSQAAAVTGAPALRDPMSDPEYAGLKKQNETLMNPYQFTAMSDSEPNVFPGPDEAGMKVIGDNSDRMQAIVKTIDAEHREEVRKWAATKTGQISEEYRRLAGFWYKLSDGAMDRWNVTPEFRQTTIGQFMQSAGSVPATAALAAMGPGGWVGMEGSFYAQVESERSQQEGAAYNPDAALPANLASAIPQMVLERALGVERLMNGVLGDLPKMAGKVRFGDFAKTVSKQALVAGVEEGIENPAQGAWNDFMASLTYDQKREVLTGEGAKKRLVEGVSGFILGGLFGGGIATVDAADTNRRVNAGQEYLTTKDGQVYAAEDFNVLRAVKSDAEILAQANDPETGRVLLAAANGDKAAQADYNNRTLSKLFVKTEGEEVGGLALGQVNGVPVVKMADGMIVPLDMTVEEDRNFVSNMKKEVARQVALKETVDFLGKTLEPGRTVEVTPEAKTLQDFINEAKLDVGEASARIGIANDVNVANLPEGVKPEDVAVLGANIAEYQQGVYKDVSHIYAGGSALTAVEEVAEGYIKKRLAVGDVQEALIAEWRAAYEAATGTKTTTTGKASNVEWFSKRVVDYAVANRKAEGMPKSLNGFFRTLGDHLKTVFRLAQRLTKLKRDGKLDANFENHLKAAIGMMTPGEVETARTQSGRAARQAQLEEAFAGLDTDAQFRSEALDYQRLKEQLRAEADAADAAAVRERDFLKARIEEKLQGMVDNQLAGDESVTMDTITPEQKWTLKAARRARDEGMTVQLSKQAQALMEEEGYDEQGAKWTASKPAPQGKREANAPIGVSDAAADAEIAGMLASPDATDLDAEQLAFAEAQDDFPTVTPKDGKFEVTAPGGASLGVFDSQDAAVNRALKFYDEAYRAEEMAAVQQAHALDPGLTRMLTDIRQLGGLRAVSAEAGFKGELRAIADGLPTHLRLKLFRKGGMDLDGLRDSLVERGYRYETITEMLDDIDKAVRLLAAANARGYNVTFSLAPAKDSAEFKSWFKDSKVVDDAGKPLVVFHGTGNTAGLLAKGFSHEFTDKGQDQFGSGFYFTNHESTAKGYTTAKNSNGDAKLGGDMSPGVLSVYLSLQDPIMVDGAKNPREQFPELTKAQIKKLILASPNIRDPEMSGLSNWGDLTSEKFEDVLAQALGAYDGHPFALANDFYPGKAKEFLTAYRKVAGHDGVIISFPTGENHYVAWFPEQVKLAGDTTFSLAPKGQGDLFSGGETGGDTMFNLQGEQAQDFTGVVDKQAASAEAKAKAAKDQGELTFELAQFSDKWTALGVQNYLSERKGVITLAKVIVPKELRGKSLGTQFMQELTDIADATQQRIVLTPSDDFGATSVGRLRDFYKRFGFVDNKGKNKDFALSESMVREPMPVPQSDITMALTGIPQTPQQALQAQAARISAKRQAATGQLIAAIQAGQTIPKRVSAVRRTQQASILARLAVPLSTRLGAIAPSLKGKMRQFEFGLGQTLLRDMEAVTPFLRGMEGMKDNDALVLDLALKNGDTQTRDALLNIYGLQPAFAQVQALLAATRLRAIDVGYDVGEIPDYFPRHVLDVDGLMTHYYGMPQASAMEQALADAGAKALAQGRVLTLDERIDIVNTALRGYGAKEASKPSNVKARRTDVVDMHANAYYADSAHALIGYVEAMNQAIEKRRFFGKSGQTVPPAGPGLTSRLNLEASIGGYVESLIASGEITRAQQREVSDMLEARFSTQASSEFIKAFKTLGYITTMGKVTSAITQIQDLAFSLYENGVFDTMVATAKAGVKKSKISKQELGLEAMAEEFKDAGKMAKLLQLTFKLTGLTYMDGVGKEAITNAKFARMSREARTGKLSARTQEIIARTFPPADRARVITELAAGAKTEDTLFAVWNVLADYQPISASEYPEAYLRHPNGRVFYMLKSYTLKQIDSFRREGITLIVNGNAKQKAIGFRNLTHLAALLFLVGVPVDWIKDAIMGRDPQLPDIAVDNVFKLIGVSRWNLWRFRDHKDPVKAAMELVTPPAPFLSYPIADVFDAAAQVAKGEDILPGEFESWKMLPWFGDPIYWLLGGGRTKVEKRRAEREKHAPGNRVNR